MAPKKMMKILTALQNIWLCDHNFVEDDVKVRDYCHVTGKYGAFVQRYCNINASLNYKISIIFRNLNNYDAHLIMQELGKVDPKINIIPNRLENI